MGRGPGRLDTPPSCSACCARRTTPTMGRPRRATGAVASGRCRAKSWRRTPRSRRCRAGPVVGGDHGQHRAAGSGRGRVSNSLDSYPLTGMDTGMLGSWGDATGCGVEQLEGVCSTVVWLCSCRFLCASSGYGSGQPRRMTAPRDKPALICEVLLRLGRRSLLGRQPTACWRTAKSLGFSLVESRLKAWCGLGGMVLTS